MCAELRSALHTADVGGDVHAGSREEGPSTNPWAARNLGGQGLAAFEVIAVVGADPVPRQGVAQDPIRGEQADAGSLALWNVVERSGVGSGGGEDHRFLIGLAASFVAPKLRRGTRS